MKLKRISLTVLLLGLPIVAVAADSATEAREWLERMVRGIHELNYRGTFVYSQGQNLEAMQVIHRGGPDGERQRLIALTGPPREVVVADNRIVCLLPEAAGAGANNGYRKSPLPFALPRDLGKLEGNYVFTLLGEDRVAGLNARIVAIEPRDKLRFGHRLWLEARTGMILRSAVYDESGQLLEQMMFTGLEFRPEIDEAMVALPEPASMAAVPAESPAANPTASRWFLNGLPAGFDQVTHNRITAAPSQTAKEHIVLTDGLATVSVFVEPLAGGQPPLKGAARKGAMNAFGTVIDDHQILVVGEVPQATVQKIATAVRPVTATVGP
jgi:sigma-E factor negative regulatory protein RseB